MRRNGVAPSEERSIGAPGIRLRVHFAAIGFEVERLVRPLETMKADAVVLIAFSSTDKAQRAFERVQERLTGLRIPSIVLNTDIWDASQVVNEIGATVSSAPQHEYFANLSTGPKPACIAAAMAATFWPVRPYYVPVNYAKNVSGPGDHPVAGPPEFLTTFSASPPDLAAMTALAFLVTCGRPVSKKDLLAHMEERGRVGATPGKKSSAQSLHGQLDTILGRLEGWGFVRREGRGKPMRIHLTDSGKGGYKMFHHTLSPRRAPAILAV